jgi:hypothetical protein
MLKAAKYPPSYSLLATRVLTLLTVAGCLSISVSAQDSLPQLDLDTPIRLDFSGSWEKDFRRSDNWEDELSRTLRIRQETAARQQSSPGSGMRSSPQISLGNVNLPRNHGRGSNIVDLARLAEYISRQNTIEIKQTRDEIRIERNGEAALICATTSMGSSYAVGKANNLCFS